METIVNTDSTRPKTSMWMLRPILWFASAYTINIILHETAHAVAAYALGFPSTLFNFWANPDLTRATMNQRAAVGIAGPAFSLCFGAVCWLTYRRVKESAAGMPLAYLSAFGLSMFFGNVMSVSFVGDFSNAAMVLNLPGAVRGVASVLGGISVAVILFVSGRELLRWTPQDVGRLAAALGVVALPALVGTMLVVLVNQPMPMPVSFLAARAGEGTFWAFAAVGLLVTRSRPIVIGDSGLQLRPIDGVLAVILILAVRLMVRGISLTP